MVIHKEFESNCKRIAKEIMKIASDPSDEQFDDMICFGDVTVDVSKVVITDFKAVGKAKYEKEINKHLKGCRVKYKTHGYSDWFIQFDVEFDDDDI